jgi:pimeloyl-ACP methyl ester carboxylesterase
MQTASGPTPHSSAPPNSDTTRIETGWALVDGIQIYYEVHGRHDGTPLVLLHGGGSTIDSTFGRVIPFLARTRRVIALEEQGHGRTSDRDQPFTFERSADDVAGLLRHLRVPQADLLGFSNGASVALQVAIRHPQMVGKLVFASSFTKREGAQPQLWEFMKQADIANMPQALKEAFLAVNPDPRRLKTMHDKDAARMAAFTDLPDAAVRSVVAPTLVITGDRDVARVEHALALSRLFPDARLIVLPSGHGDYLAEASSAPADTGYAEITARLVERFLSEPQPAR